MKWYAVSLLLVVAMGSTLAREKRFTFRAHTEANANDGAVFAAPLRSDATGRKLYIGKAPALTERDIQAFRPYPADDGTFGVLLQLDQHGKLSLDTLSVERRGSVLFIFVNGRQLSELQIDRRVSDGRIYLGRGLTEAEIELMRKEWPLLGQKKR